MKAEETILNNNQLQQVLDTLENNKNETDTLLEKIEKEHENDDNSNAPLEEGIGTYITEGTIIEDSIDDDISCFDNLNSSLDEILEDNLKNTLNSNYNISNEEAITFANLIIKARNGENVDVYNNLPKELKSYINNIATEQKIPDNNKKQFLHFAAKSIIDEMVKDAEISLLSFDLEKAMQEMLPTPTEMYSEANKEYIENEFPKVAEKIKEESPEKAQNLLDMRQGYIDAYTFDTMYQILNNSKVFKNVRRSNKLWSRINTYYLQVAGVCRFKLHPLSDLEIALSKLDFSEEQSKRIITLFVYAYLEGIEDIKDPNEYNNIYRNSFANYFESNIINLSINKNLISDFSKKIKENLISLSNHIDELIANKEGELSNKKYKKRR